MTDKKIADYYEVFKGKSGQFYVRLVSSNGEGIFTSEGYEDKSYAEHVGADTGLPSKEEFDGN